MALFNRGGGPGGKMGKGTKPKGAWGAEKGKPPAKMGTRNKVYSSQQPAGSKPMGKYGGQKPMGKKPMGKYGSAGMPKSMPNKPKPRTTMRSGPSAPVPRGQEPGRNGIPNGQDNTPRMRGRSK